MLSLRLGRAVTSITAAGSPRRRLPANSTRSGGRAPPRTSPRVRATTSAGRTGPGGRLSQRERLQVVAHVLLVEARRARARRPGVPRPEARRVGRQRLVDPDEPAVVTPELELGIGQDDPPRLRVGARAGVEGEARRPRLLGARLPPTRSAISANVMFSSWPDSALVAGVKSGAGSRSASRSPEGSVRPHTAPAALGSPSSPIPPGTRAPRTPRAGAPSSARSSSGPRAGRGGRAAPPDTRRRRPSARDEGRRPTSRRNQKSESCVRIDALARDPGGEHDVEGAEAIRGYHEQAVRAELVDVAHLALPPERERQPALQERGAGRQREDRGHAEADSSVIHGGGGSGGVGVYRKRRPRGKNENFRAPRPRSPLVPRR